MISLPSPPKRRFARLIAVLFGFGLWGVALVGSALAQAPDSSLREELFPNASIDACCRVPDRWWARSSVVNMDRITDDSMTLIQSTANNFDQINANDFNFETAMGTDTSLMRVAWDDSAIELRYFDLGEMTALASTTPGGSQVRIESTPPVFAPNVQTINSRYTTDLYSIEANYRYPLYRCVTVFGGIRYISLEDQLGSLMDAGPQTFRHQVSTENEMYGAQIGGVTVSRQPVLGPIYVNAAIKAGFYGNDAVHRSSVETAATTLFIDASADDVAFFGECSVTAEVPLYVGISLLVGYDLLWFERVALASDQVAVSDFINGIGSDHEGRAIFHGARAGVEIRF